MPRPFGSADVIESRRHRALALLDKGFSINEVGRLMDCAPSSVMRWRNARKRGGKSALKVRFSPGRPPKLSPEKRKRLVLLLLQGPMAQGYRTDLWTTARIAELVKRKFKVHYHPDHVGRLMHSLGFSHQKPERRALERNEDAISKWKKKDWPRIKKTPGGWALLSSSSTNPASA
jgi:transposase